MGDKLTFGEAEPSAEQSHEIGLKTKGAGRGGDIIITSMYSARQRLSMQRKWQAADRGIDR